LRKEERVIRYGVQVGSVLLAVLAGWVVPALGLKALMPALESGAPKIPNYRGVPIPTGLGMVWLIWAVAWAFFVAVVQLKAGAFPGLLGDRLSELMITPGVTVWAQLAMPVLLVVGAFALGLFDDVYGDGEAKGFRGHLAALGSGRLTTGGLKMLGIGLLAAVTAATLTPYGFKPVLAMPNAWSSLPAWGVFGTWVLATLVIALTTNLVNLMDLRPGRALKVYSVIAVPTALWLAWWTWRAAQAYVGSFNLPMPGRLELAGMAVSLLVLVVGPVFAAWPFDLGEKAMLGDAGSNAAGALAGYLLAATLTWWGLAIAAAVLLALNIASERVSFTNVIEGNGALRWFDELGRVEIAEGEAAHAPGATAPPDDDRDGSADVDAGKDG
jgi:UDP-GlcNAc:undecaprenyl-phosphate/decaprenyl-phosphate GlcNAc-1-phosphate transferase